MNLDFKNISPLLTLSILKKLWIKKLEIKRNKIIKQAERLYTENNFAQAISSYKDADEILQTEDFKTKIAEIEKKTIEIKQNELIKSANQYVTYGNVSNSIEKLEKAKKLFTEANKLTFNDAIRTKIIEVERKIRKIKQVELNESAKQDEKI